MSIAVSARAIVKDFPIDGDRSIRVLQGITAEIKMGQLTMLVGPSGCGKTTLISILTGILSETSGEVTVIGHALHDMSDREKVIFRREHIGFIFQQFNLLPALTAAENAAMPLIAAGMDEDEATQRAREVFAQIDMEDEADKLPRQLSGGQQQRVAIARALVHRPKLIVCDEPTASLDGKTGKAVMDILREAARDAGRAVLVVTHDNRIFHYADRILEMTDGQLIGDTTAEAFIQKVQHEQGYL